jgi:integrase
MAKRANGEGSIGKAADGRWWARLTVDGKRKVAYGKTRAEAAQKLTQLLRARDAALPIPSQRQTLADYLKGWLEAIEGTVRPRTFAEYERLVKRHIIPELGKLPVARLTPQDVERLAAAKRKGGLSPQTVLHVHRALHTALERAARQGLVVRNVVSLADPPRVPRRETRILTPEESKTLITTAANHEYGALFVVAVTCGLREGELLALRWADVDLGEKPALTVKRSLVRIQNTLQFAEPKSARSRRRVVLPAAAVAALKRHRAQQLEARLKLGAAWTEADLVFPDELGRPMDATRLLRRYWLPFLEQAGLPRVRLHDLRHTAASLLLAEGIHPKVASETLGHSAIGITMDLYSHTLPTLQEQAAEAMDRLFRT